MTLALHLPKVVLHLPTQAGMRPELAQEKLGQGFACEEGVLPAAGHGSELRLFYGRVPGDGVTQSLKISSPMLLRADITPS